MTEEYHAETEAKRKALNKQVAAKTVQEESQSTIAYRAAVCSEKL